MRSWVLVVAVCWGCAGAKVAPSSRPKAAQHADISGDTTERRPYAEVMLPATEEALASPGLALSIKNPQAFLGSLPPAPGAKPLAPSPAEALSLVTQAIGMNVAAIVDLERPVEFAVSVDDSLLPGVMKLPKLAVAFNVRSNEALELGEAGLLLKRLDAGLWQIGEDAPDVDPSPTNEDYEDDADADADDDGESESDDMGPAEAPANPCLLAHSAGGFRVLCGLVRDDVKALAPFLMRDLPTLDADLHLELGGPTYHQVVAAGVAGARQKLEQEPHTLDAGERVGRDLGMAAVETLGAHQRIAVDGRFEGDGAKLELEVTFPRGEATSGLADWARANRERSLPASFGLLPGDGAWSGSFVGLGRELGLRSIRRFLDVVAEEVAVEYVASPRDVEEITAAFAGIVPADAHISFAAGSDLASVERALNSDAVLRADEAERPLPAASVKALQAALGGWVTFAFDVPPATYLPAVERALRANKLAVRRRPGVPIKPTEREESRTKRGPVSVAGLPPGTIHVISETRPRKGYRPPADGSRPPILPYEQHWLIVPDGERIWATLARSEVIAGERALAALRGQARLSERTDTGKLIGRPVLAACSFTSLGSRLEGLEWDSARQRNVARKSLRIWHDSVAAGDEPLLLTLEPAPERAPDSFGLRMVLHVGPGTLAQLVSSLTRGRGRPD